MKNRSQNKKNWILSKAFVIGLATVSILFMTGCSDKSGSNSSDETDGTDVNTSLCNVPLEANLNTTVPGRIGGATTAVELFEIGGEEWTFFNISNELRAAKVGASLSTPGLEMKGSIRDIEMVTVGDTHYALLAMGDEGIAAVNITDPAAMAEVSSVKVNYDHAGITWTEGGGDIIIDNNISSMRAPITSLAVYDDGNESTPLELIIGDEEYGLHKTALGNLLNANLGADGTLLIDGPEEYTLQYAGENPWGGPKNLKLFGEGNNTRLFVAQGFLGMGIYNPETLQKVGYYNLYTDVTEKNGGEDWFIDMNVSTQVSSGENGRFLDVCTGMPDYRQTSFEILDIWHGGTTASTPWADFDRYGKFYYDARKIDVATFETLDSNKTIAYIAYGLGGLVAVDVTGYDKAEPRIDCASNENFLEAQYLGYVPGLPAHGPDAETGQQSESIFSYFGVGMLKEAGTVDVKVDTATNTVYFSDHFAGLMVIGNADDPETNWHGTLGEGKYDNDDIGVLGDHWPDYEFVTSYDMTLVPLGDEEVPTFINEDPILLATGEVSGHGNVFGFSSTFNQNNSSSTDVVLAAGGGGLSFIDIFGAPAAPYNFAVLEHFATTDEIGAAADGTATQEINIGHSEGVTSYGNLLFLGDGPHGMSVWNIGDKNCVPTDDVHLVANTLQSEYPVGDINPTPHAYDVVLDVANQSALVMSQSRGLRRVVGTEMGTVGAPVLLYPKATDIYEHNTDAGNEVDFLSMQDHAYDTALKGSLAFTADGSNGLTVYDLSKDPTNPTSGYLVSNVGGDTDSKPDLGRVTGVALWDGNGKSYAFVAAGSAGVGVVDITDEKNMSIVKVFEPIKLEDEKAGKADGKSVAVKVVGEYAFFTYDSFGIVAYKITDLIAPLIDGTDPTKIWGQGEVDQRPNFVARFKLQDSSLFGWEELSGWSGGAAGMDVVSVGDKNFFYVAYGNAGVIKIDWTNPGLPVLIDHANTVGEALDVTVINGRVYVADGSGGLALLK